MCLKFQLTKKSARLIVARAICKKSAKLVWPTTFSEMYSEANSTASSVVSRNSVFSALIPFTSSLLFLVHCQVPLELPWKITIQTHYFLIAQIKVLYDQQILYQSNRQILMCRYKFFISYVKVIINEFIQIQMLKFRSTRYLDSSILVY